jgi:WD40 repeat protein
VAVWRINVGGTVERRAALTSGGVRSLSLSGNGRYLATAGGVAQVWDLALANVPLRATLLAPQHFEFNRIAASIAGDWIAAVDVMDNLFVWRWRDRAADVDASTAPPVPTPREAAVTGAATGAAATGAGERVAERVAARPVVVDPQPELAEGIGGAVSGLAIDPEARWVAVSSLDRAVRVFHLEADKLERAVLSHNAPVRDIAVGPTGEWLFSRCEDGTTLVWEMFEERLFDPRLNLRPSATLGGVPGDSRVSDGASGPAASGSAEVADGSQTSRIASGFSGSSGAASLVFSRTGGWLSSLEGDGQVRGWVVGAGNGAGAGPVALPLETLSLPGGPWKPLAWAVSPRGDRVAALIAGTAEAARSIEVWRIDTGRGFVLEQALRVDMAPAVASALADALPSPGSVELVFSGTGDALALLAAAPENGSTTAGSTTAGSATAGSATAGSATAGSTTAGSANSPSRTATGSPSSAEGMIGHVSLWRITDTDLATRLPRASDFQLSEPLRDLRFGANWLLGLTPNGRLRIWSRSANGPVPAKDDGEAFVEQQVAAHAPARELRLSPRGQRLALLHEPPANRNAAAVISVWGPPAEAVGEWTQTGSWECATALPTFVLGDRWLIVGEQVAPGDSRLRGFSVAGGPAKRWELRYPVLPEFRVSRDGERLLAIAAGVARLYEVAEAPRERAAVRLWADAIGGLQGDSDAAASVVDTGQAGERPRVWSWSPDGRWFAVVDGGAVVWWDFDAGAVPPRQTAELSLEQCQRLFFDSHSDFFIALDERGVARVCPTRRGDWVVAARRAAGRNFTLAEWEAAGARRGEPYRETFPGWGAGVVAARTTPRPDAVDAVRTDVPIAEETDGRRTLRYHLESLPMLGEADKAAAIVREAWRAWEAAGPLRSVEVSAAERPHVVVRAERLDGPAGAPAHGQLGPPRESVTLELRLDAEQTWTEDLLRLVATHELGHLLGLGHTATPGQLMSDSVPDSVRTPQAEDIQRLRAMWSRSNGR